MFIRSTKLLSATSLIGALAVSTGVVAAMPPAAQMGGLDQIAPAAEATHVALGGVWSDPAAWESGIPGDGARVRVPEGVEMVLDVDGTARLDWLRLEGTLRFATDRDTELRVETIAGFMASRLEIGTVEAPIAETARASILFIDDGPIDQSTDPMMLGRGLITMGAVRMHGAAKLPYAAVVGHRIVGDTSFTLADVPSGWQVGDRVVLTGTEPLDPASDEVRTIVTINGSEIAFDAPLERDHDAPAEDLLVHAANLDRNVRLRSESDEILRRAHVMFMHTHDVDCRHVRFHRLGRTNKRVQLDDWFFPNLDAGLAEPGPATNRRGRYSVHFHRGGVDPSAPGAGRIEGCVVEDDPGWAYVNHSSHVDFIENVSYDVVGGAFQTESGDEIGSFIRNLAIRTVNPDHPILTPETEPVDIREDSQDFAFQGDGFWFHGGAVAVEGNIASGCSGHGFIYWTEGIREVGTPFDFQNMFLASNVPDGDLLGDLDQIGSWFVPLRSFRDNTAYSVAKGLAAYYIHTTQFDDLYFLPQAYIDTMHSTLENTTLWNVQLLGVELQNCERFTFDGLRIENFHVPGAIGIQPWHTVAEQTIWRDCVVKGFDVGMVPPTQGDVTIDGGVFANAVDFELIPPQKDSFEPADARDLLIANIAFEQVDFIEPGERVHFDLLAGPTLRGELPQLNPEDAHLLAMIPDRIVVDLEDLGRRRLYYAEQAPDFAPVTIENIGDAKGTYRTEVLNRTNTELMDSIGLCFAGALLPSDAVEVSGVDGGFVGPTTSASMPAPNCLFIEAKTLPPNFFDAFDFYECWDTSTPIGVEVAPFEHEVGNGPCPADLTTDGELDFFDVIEFLCLFASGAPGGDFNGDGALTPLDIQSLLIELSLGCP